MPDKQDAQDAQDAQDDRELIEEFARLYRTALPRIAAQMLALALIEGRELTSHEISSRLGVSASSVSSMGRLLIRQMYLTRRVSPETRGDLFSVTPDLVISGWLEAQDSNTKIADWAERAIHVRSDNSNEDLRALRDFARFLAIEIPPLLEKYQRTRKDVSAHLSP